MESNIDTVDPRVTGAKGLVFIGNDSDILVYRRDTNTDIFPLHLDLPGGGVEEGESPFEAFQREVGEEFGLQVIRNQITYSWRYPHTPRARKYGEFIVAQLPPGAERHITFGPEGVEYMLMPVDEYVSRGDAWPLFQDRTRDYLDSLAAKTF